MSNKNSRIKHAENEAIHWLARLNSPQFSEKDEKKFMQWLESSPLNQAAYINAEELWERGSILAQLPETPFRKKPIFQLETWQGWAFACTFIIALSGLFLLRTDNTSTYQYETAIGEQREIQLDDGSHITLNTNSKLRVELNNKFRRTFLTKGEAFFDVKKDGRTFDVITTNGTVHVLGTHFSVYQQLTDTLVTVIEGQVALGETPNNPSEFKAITRLQANEYLHIESAKKGEAPKKINATTALAWRKKQLVFNGRNLEHVITELSRYFPQQIVLDSAELGSREITAVIPLSDVNTAVNAIAQSLKLNISHDSDQRIHLISATSSK